MLGRMEKGHMINLGADWMMSHACVTLLDTFTAPAVNCALRNHLFIQLQWFKLLTF